MELLRLLAHDKHGGGATSSSAKGAPGAAAATTIATTVLDGGGDSEDEGPFFDLEFALPLQEEDDQFRREKQRQSSSGSESDEEDDEFDLAVSPHRGRYCGSVRRDPVASHSPSDDLFFKGRLDPLEPSSLNDFAAAEPRSNKPRVPAFLIKSAAKLRVLRLGFHRKSTSASLQTTPAASPAMTTTASPKQQNQSNFFVKCKVDEVPLASLFTRDSSSRSSCSSSSRSVRFYTDEGSPASDVRKLPKDVIQRYLSKIKPLYVRISKRYGEKLRFSGPLSGGAGKVGPAGEAGGGDQPKDSPFTLKGSLKPQDGNIPAGLRMVCRRLRKSRSASAAVASVRSPPLATRRRRDDSLLEQQDGIQSAIAHCKRSFNRGSESPLLRSRSDPGDGRSVELRSSSSISTSSSNV